MMKFQLLTIFAIFFLVSCSDDIEIDSSVLQGVKDSVLYRSVVNRAEMRDGGRVELSGSKNQESLKLNLSSVREGTFYLGAKEDNSAEFIDVSGKKYSTFTDGEGEIVVERISGDNFTGSFKFKAKSLQDSTEVIFTRGVFYEVPLRETIEESIPEATVVTSFDCKINTIPFKPTVIEANVVNNEISGYGGTPGIIIRLIFPQNIDSGIYELSDLNSSEPYRAEYYSNGFRSYLDSGTIEITSHNKEEHSVGGTFFFSASNNGTVEVTEGSFGFNY